MIELKNVTKFYRTTNSRKYILRDVTMTLPPKTNIGIVGRNGAGKSTILRMLGGIDFPNSGTISSPCTFSWPLALGGGFVGHMSALDNVKFVCRVFAKSRQETRKIVQQVEEFCELGDYFTMPMKSYSSGMKSRVGFGLSLAFDFDYILIDETLAVGDARFRKKSEEALKEKISKSNVLLVAHQMGTLRKICQAGLLVHEGRLTYYDEIDQAIEKYEEINKIGKKK